MENSASEPVVDTFVTTSGASGFYSARRTLAEDARSVERPRLIAKGILAPLLHRVAIGEGGLFVVNTALAWKYQSSGDALSLSVISLVCLLGLYLFNDIVDARADLRNPKKDHTLAAFYAGERTLFFSLWLFITGFAVVAATLIDGRAAGWVVTVSLINVAYSLLCKKVRVLDVACVGMWGAAFVAIVTDATAWVVLVGAMTAICHIYQASEDRDVDTANGVQTSARLTRPILSMLQGTAIAILIGGTWALGAHVAALTLVAFLMYWMRWRDQPRTAWIVTKVHFTVVLAFLLMRS